MDQAAPAPTVAQPRWRRPLLVVLAVLLLLPLIAWWLFDPNWLKGRIESRVQQATGREFAIDGDLGMRFGLPLTITADDVRMGNAAWAEEADMLRVAQVELRIWPWQALRGNWHIQRMTLRQPWLLLQRNEDGEGNWQSLVDPDADGEADLRIDRLLVRDGKLRFVDAALDSDVAVSLASASRTEETGADTEAEAAEFDTLLLKGSGRFRGEDFSLQGEVASPLDLRDGDETYGVNLGAQAGATKATVVGDIALQFPGPLDQMAVDLTLQGDNLGDLDGIIDLALPETAPYRLAGLLVRDGTRWEFREFTGTLGDSDIAGTVSIDHRGERPFLEARLHSELLHIDDLSGVLGGVPDPDGTVSEAQRREAQRRAALGRIFPDREIAKGALRDIDADIHMVAKSIQPRRWPLDSMDVRVTARDGAVEVDPLQFTTAGGRIEAKVDIDATQAPMRFKATAKATGMQVQLLFPDAEFAQGARGRIGGELSLAGRGESVADMLGSADGEFKLLMGNGRVRGPGDGNGFDFAAMAGFISDDDGWMTIRCGVVDAAVESGTATARSMAIDAEETLIVGEGGIDLGAERWDLTLHPQPKRARFPSARTPARVEGPLGKPSIDAQKGALLARGAAAALLYSLAPPAALLALVGTGPGEDIDCSGVVAGAGDREDG
jgi:AsmA family protein